MSYRAFWQRRCRAAAAGAVLKPQGGNCAVLPYICTFPGLWPGFACRFILTLIVIVPPRPVKLPAYFPLAVPFYFQIFSAFWLLFCQPGYFCAVFLIFQPMQSYLFPCFSQFAQNSPTKRSTCTQARKIFVQHSNRIGFTIPPLFW